MTGGVFAVDRRIFQHRIFANEPYTEREAWLWLIGEAAWKPKRVRTPHGMISVERAQLVHSQRFLATKWRWDRSRVRRFLSLLESEGMVTQQRPSNDPAMAHETTRLTICNYDKYQFGGPSNDPDEHQETNRKRPKEEEVINKKKILEGAHAEKKSRKKPTRPMPDIFPMNEAQRAYAEKRGYKFEIPPCFAFNKARPGPAQEMFAAFKNYHAAKGSQFADWDAAWRTWVDNQVKWDTERGKPPGLRPAI
jgi:hypothetical protein